MIGGTFFNKNKCFSIAMVIGIFFLIPFAALLFGVLLAGTGFGLLATDVIYD
jgi:hypothetical protein